MIDFGECVTSFHIHFERPAPELHEVLKIAKSRVSSLWGDVEIDGIRGHQLMCLGARPLLQAYLSRHYLSRTEVWVLVLVDLKESMHEQPGVEEGNSCPYIL
jgi:hypothetical protein